MSHAEWCVQSKYSASEGGGTLVHFIGFKVAVCRAHKQVFTLASGKRLGKGLLALLAPRYVKFNQNGKNRSAHMSKQHLVLPLTEP